MFKIDISSIIIIGHMKKDVSAHYLNNFLQKIIWILYTKLQYSQLNI